MNAIFAIAFFAVCASATFDIERSSDLSKLLRYKHQDNDYLVKDLFRTTGLFGRDYNTRVQTPWVLPRSYYNNVDTTTVYTLEEIVRHPLFRQYITLPLFRQHLRNPVFQYYLSTPLFQQYWTIPQFQTFFTNPYLFNKYIYPVVYNTHDSTYSSIYDQLNNHRDTFNYPEVDRQVVDVDRYLKNGVYDKDVVFPVDSHYNRYPTKYDQYYPFSSIYNKYSKYDQYYPSRSIYNQDSSVYPVVNRHHLPYTYVLDKIFKRQQKPDIEVLTDVKVVDNKKVDDYTRDYKIVDGQIVPVVGDRRVDVDDIVSRRPVVDSIFGDEKYNRYDNVNVKDAILRRLYLNKIYGDRKVDEVVPEYTEELNKHVPIFDKIDRLQKLHQLEDIVGKIDGVEKFDKIDELTRRPVEVDSADLLRQYKKDLLYNHEKSPLLNTKTVIV
jgi:hypothetical protein